MGKERAEGRGQLLVRGSWCSLARKLAPRGLCELQGHMPRALLSARVP